MGTRSIHSALAIFGISVGSFFAPHVTSDAAAQGWRFHLEEATLLTCTAPSAPSRSRLRNW